MEIVAYEMKYNKSVLPENVNIECIPFDVKYFEEYRRIYNECFYDMRKSLEIEPYNYLLTYEQIEGKIQDIYLLIQNEKIIGSVACYGNEIDDLIVNREFQNNGYGTQLLLWGMRHVREKNDEPIILHVAEWNVHAVRLYKKVGFEVTKVERVR